MMEAPDEATVMAILLAANSPGHVKTTRTTVLITLREAMVAMRRAHDAQYRGPHGD